MKRYYYMDVLNILATFAVVMLHGSSYAFSNAMDHRWDVSVLIQVLFIFAVPIFFMLSGANNLDYRDREDTKTFFLKRLRRVGIPFMTWSVLWFVYENSQNWHLSWTSLRTYSQLFDGLMHNGIQPIFWYFYFIIGFYLSVPLLSKITVDKQKQLVQYLLVLNIVFVELVSYYYSMRQQPDTLLSGGLSIGFSGSIGFFILGWYLKHFPLSKKWARILYVAAVVSALIMIVLTVVLSKHRGEFQRQVYNIWGIFGFLWSAGVFVFFQNHFSEWIPSIKMQGLLKRLAGASLGVYVIHYFFIESLEQNNILMPRSWWHILVMPIIVWAISVILVWLIKKIPYLRRIV
ncbi:acyltransferase family protein [Fructobacillus sp. W13]|uniref:Acyltransferase family protein n=1 Tax=Fructobacillus apis TaxID=2935017 RepID=A0ABT0ZNX4_9LACO|nr:acyltransferase family protein [Fructobacillus apis]MCO0831695.1 acyltransferase family protein [Fructobacillus apis]